MQEKLIYLFSVVAVGWLVTFILRALPFAIFARRTSNTPKGLSKIGDVISPIIIGALIVYSFSTLKIDSKPAWSTLWPYIATAFTVALHLLFKNSLASIAGGTAIYMMLISFCGCSSLPTTIEFDARNPVLHISDVGVSFAGRLVDPYKVPKLLRKYDIPKDRTVHILATGSLRDLRPARQLMAILCKAGYRRPVIVTERKAHSHTVNQTQKNKNNIRRSL